jgi:hypothetical protein
MKSNTCLLHKETSAMSRFCNRYIGIDFSGSQAQWQPNAQSSNVWIALMEEQNTVNNLIGLQRVQQLPGEGRPFYRLSQLLGNGEYGAAAIDAPFSVPWWFFGANFVDHNGLLAAVNDLPINHGADFPTGAAFVECVAAGIQFPFSKPLRTTESYWRGRSVNIRSTVWNGVRPGAPFASSSIKLLAEAARPLWPWSGAEDTPILAESFPAAQLRAWNLPFDGYNGDDGQANRAVIVEDLVANRGLQITNDFEMTILGDADALDAVLSCYAARAVKRNQLGAPLPPVDSWRLEGWIAVHN